MYKNRVPNESEYRFRIKGSTLKKEKKNELKFLILLNGKLLYICSS